MPVLQHLCQILYDSSFGTAIRESDYAFSVIESVHVLGITALFGTIAILDLRMLGLVLRGIAVTRVARAVFPITWGGFSIMFVSGFLLFWSEAAKNYTNPAFRIKMVSLVLAILFSFTLHRRVTRLDESHLAGAWPKWAAVISLVLWTSVGLAGRAIGYVPQLH